MHQIFETESNFAHAPKRTLRPSSVCTLICYIQITTEDRTLYYPIPLPLLLHQTPAIITDCNRSPTLYPGRPVRALGDA